MGDIEHGPCCDVCGVLYVTEYEGPCQERRPSGIVCGGHVSWEAAFDRLADDHRGAVDRERNYREALERITNTKSIDLAIGIASLALGTNHPGGRYDSRTPPRDCAS